MNDFIYERLLKLPRKNLINLMWESLDFMQQYNGRSKLECIMLSLGSEELYNEKDQKIWNIPSIKKMKEVTDNFPSL